MRVTSASQGLAVLSLSALFSPVFGRLAMVIGVPECAANGHGTAKNIWEVDAGQCQTALLKVYGHGADEFHPPSSIFARDGCKTIESEGSCSVHLCNARQGEATISAGAIATAAQDIHSYCRLNGKAGGRVTVYTQDKDGKEGSVIVQLGEIRHDETKREDATNTNTAHDDPTQEKVPVPEARDLQPTTLRYARRTTTDRRSDPEDVDNASGVNEGEQHQIRLFDLLNLQNAFIADIRRVFAEPNPNWQNTAVAAGRFTDEGTNRQVQVTVGYLARDGTTTTSAFRQAASDGRLATLVASIMGQWRMGGFRTLFSNHIFRYFNGNEDGPHVELGEVVITVEDIIPDYAPPLALLPGGSMQMKA